LGGELFFVRLCCSRRENSAQLEELELLARGELDAAPVTRVNDDVEIAGIDRMAGVLKAVHRGGFYGNSPMLLRRDARSLSVSASRE